MPAVTPSSTVLITGANGYIGAWVTKLLLDRGFTVRAAVRSRSKSGPLEEIFPSFVADGKLTFVVVEDILNDGAYDEALVGVDGVLHLASPVASAQGGADPETFLQPAIKGTSEILQGALKLSQAGTNSVKRIVITSSAAAVYTPREIGAEPRVFSEKDWNDAAVTEVRSLGKDAQGMVVYRASKVLAEKAAWEIYEANKSAVPWDLVVLNPPFVYGPPIQNLTKPEDLGSTMKMWYDLVVAPGPKSLEILQMSQGWVDVRDLAEAHVRALLSEKAGGERIIVSSGSYVTQEWLDVANAVNAKHGLGRTLPSGSPEITKGGVAYSVQYDTSRERELLALQVRSKEETTKDILEWVASRGW